MNTLIFDVLTNSYTYTHTLIQSMIQDGNDDRKQGSSIPILLLLTNFNRYFFKEH